jgi:maleylacetate reductase
VLRPGGAEEDDPSVGARSLAPGQETDVADQRFVYDALPGRVVFGVGSARTELAGELDRLAAARALLVCSERDVALADELTRPFADRVAGRFHAVREHVPAPTAQAARDAARQAGADLVLAIGGGSAVGTAKAVALTDRLPVLAVPTTYAGSEMTPVWGLTEDGRKTTGTDRAVLPRTVLYDPELTLSLPAGLSVASGLNALAHSVEAFWAPGRNPVTSLGAEESVRALAQGLPAVLADPADLAGRTRALYGAYLAGAAFAVAGAGLHHKICHVLGGSFGLPHARTHAVVLPYVLAFNAPAAPDAAGRVAAALGAGKDPHAAAGALTSLALALGAPTSLRELGMPEDGLDRAAELVTPAVPADNPRPVTVELVRDMLTQAWEGLAG